MNKGLKKIPNILSISRIILSPIMLAMADRPPALAALILLIGLTDMADGFIARRYHCRSASGARLDSLGDWIFFSTAGIVFYMKYRSVVSDHIWELAAILTVRILSLCTARYRFGRFLSIHTLGNKLTVVLVFATMLFIVCESKVNEIILKTAFTTALLSAVDEYLIILTSGKIDIDRRSFFSGKTTQKRS
ncbi:CDP-alcohol phosphatidyltransferase [Tannerella forsythia 92A2]|uniref:CDP-alcohol phosphatidyltransferase n=4 Tax=Tannerella forsythia TaxID=28112 RepID=G8UPA6_TANFA|nr:CDP-alcohol phosphatidyltransferase [Tannerella forsythia 92A2]BAR50012.1 CDP-alcohol phosphatidyltransferase [Tannerella forsythia 3313]